MSRSRGGSWPESHEDNTQAASARLIPMYAQSQTRERGYFPGFEVLNNMVPAMTPIPTPKDISPGCACAGCANNRWPSRTYRMTNRMIVSPHARSSNDPTWNSRRPISNNIMNPAESTEKKRTNTIASMMEIHQDPFSLMSGERAYDGAPYCQSDPKSFSLVGGPERKRLLSPFSRSTIISAMVRRIHKSERVPYLRQSQAHGRHVLSPDPHERHDLERT